MAEASEWNLLVLGSGSSASTPKIQCIITKNSTCVCNQDPFSSKNHRLNPSILLFNQSLEIAILFDCGKTFRESVIRQFPKFGITGVNYVVLTHPHMDAIGGLDDIREVQNQKISGSSGEDKSIITEIYCNEFTENALRRIYPYMFPENTMTTKGFYVPKTVFKSMREFKPILLGDLSITPIPLWHGNMIALGFSITSPKHQHQIVYFSDFRCKPVESKEDNSLTQAAFDQLSFLVDLETSLDHLRQKPISVLFLDGLHNKPGYTYPSHSTVFESLQVVLSLEKTHKIFPAKVLFTGMSCAIDFAPTNEFLHQFKQEHCLSSIIECAFDGLCFPL